MPPHNACLDQPKVLLPKPNLFLMQEKIHKQLTAQ
jgi:hypothetical protein